MDAMFAQLANDNEFQRWIKQGKPIKFVDLGSGDGRLVFRAAREQVFHRAVGYEINPALYLLAQTRRIWNYSRYRRVTTFYLADIWKVDLTDADVVVVVRPLS